MDWRLEIRIKISILIRILKNISTTTATATKTQCTHVCHDILSTRVYICRYMLCGPLRVCIDEDKIKDINMN